MKNFLKKLTFFVLLSFTFISCENELKAPVISDVEIGYNNSKKAYIGSDLHVEANILAEGKIAKIILTIHPEGEAEHVSAQKIVSAIDHSGEWEVDSTYTGKYAGVKNTSFHEHVEIPSNAEIGDYHLHLSVVDMEGNTTEIEAEISLENLVADGKLPVVTISSAPTDGQIFSNGQAISISGIITDVVDLSGAYIGLVKADAGLTNAQVNAANSITLLHFHDFVDPKSYSFSASLIVGAHTDNDITPKSITWSSGNYFVLVKAPTIDGEVGFSARYPVKIQL